MNIKMIKAIFTDIDNTLLDFNKCSEAAIKKAMEEYNLKFQDGIINVFYEINDKLWLRIEQGTLTKEELYEVRWNMIFERFGIKTDGMKFDSRFREILHEIAEPVENAGEMLEYLSSKYPVYAVSNAFHNKQSERLEKAGMLRYIKKVFVSGEVGYSKPSKGFFDACIKELEGVKPDEVIIIGDSPTADIGGGISYGLKTCWFNYKNEPLPEDIKPDLIVNSLDEIKNFL